MNENKNFTKADLKVGYVVKYRNGNLRMVMPLEGGTLVLTSDDGSWLHSEDVNDDLTCRRVKWGEPTDSLDIMEVYGWSGWPSNAMYVATAGRKLLWKREDPKKMTVSEIEKELGYKIEVVADEK